MRPSALALLLVAAGCANPRTSAPQPVVSPSRDTVTRPASRVGPPQAPAPRAAQPTFPRSPGQEMAPPTLAQNAVSEALVRAAWQLFDEGMADPRGCEYRAVSVRVGSVWSGDAGPATLHAWVLPEARAGARRFAVTWSGIVVPVLSVGAPADLRADVAALVRASGQARPEAPFPGELSNSQEAFASSERTVTALKVPMLLRLGEPAAAAAALAYLQRGRQPLPEPHGWLATEWAWDLFDRALTAHLRGENDVALDGARRLALARPRLAASLGPSAQGQGDPLDFLASVDALLADQERRTLSPTAPPTLASIGAIADRAARVTALVAALDQVSARQVGQPGGVDLGSDPIVAALVREGDAAVSPLLAVLEGDLRLTRSVHFWRDFSRHRTLLGVHEAAYLALATILRTTAFSAASTGDSLSARGLEGRRAVAATLRTYWDRFHAVPLERRWYDTLRDETSPPERLVEAANNLTEPVDPRTQREGLAWRNHGTLAPLPVTPRPSMRGDALRSLTAPTVSEAMTQRIAALTTRALAAPEPYALHEHACALALALAEWDAPGNLPALRTYSAALLTAMERDRTARTLLASCNASLTVLRHRAGDAEALASYARWLAAGTPARLAAESLRSALAPAAADPLDPSMRRATDALFAGAAAPFGVLIAPNEAVDAPALYQLFEGPELLRIPAFNALVLRGLADDAPLGTLRWLGPRNYQLELGRVSMGGQVPQGEEPPANHPATEPLRRADVYAFLLGRVALEVRFRAHEPRERRVVGIAAMARWVREQEAR